MHRKEVPLLKTKHYNRDKALTYAHTWAFGRNPQYYDFEKLGGDCTNFTSQVLFAGAGLMNSTPTFGWYYYSLHNRAPAWTGVEFLYRFLLNNHGVGPVAVETDKDHILPGDIVQLSFDGREFTHSPVIVSVGDYPTSSNILIAAHSFDSDYRSLSSYPYLQTRFLHILHINTW